MIGGPKSPRPAAAFAILLFLLAAVFAVYCGVLLIPYAFADDYFWLDKIVLRGQNIYAEQAVQGRPLNGLILQWVFSHAGGLGALAQVRALTLCQIAALGWLFYLAMRRAGWNQAPSAL